MTAKTSSRHRVRMWSVRSPRGWPSSSSAARFAICVCALLLWAGPARADDEADQARAYHEKAKAAFALSHYGQAAEFFEKAFELKADPALLYNAAQSHRLAGNKERALTLYQNYLHVYGRDDRRAQIESRIDELKKSIERDHKEVPAKPPATWPPGTTPPPAAGVSPPPAGVTTRPAPPATAPTPVEPLKPATPSDGTGASTTPTTTMSAMPSSAPAAPTPDPAPAVLVSQPASSSDDGGSLTKKPWFWAVVGGGVAVATTVVLLVVLSGSKDPSASLGQIHGN